MKNKKLFQRSKTLTTLSSKAPPTECPQGQMFKTAITKSKPLQKSKPKINSKPKKKESALNIKVASPLKAMLLEPILTIKTIKTSTNKQQDKDRDDNNDNNSGSEFNWSESLILISEIQQLFESSVSENKKPIKDIKRLLRTTLSLEDYIPLTVREKEIIEYDIGKSSDLRIENYQMAFGNIFSSLEGIYNTLNSLVDDANDHNNKSLFDDYADADGHDNGNDSPAPMFKKKTIKLKQVRINEGHNVFYTSTNTNEDEGADYCEKIMTEKIEVLPLNSSLIKNDDNIGLLKNRSTCFLLNTPSSSLPEKETIVSPLSNSVAIEAKYKPYSSFECMDTFSDSLMVLSKAKTAQKEDCIIY